MEEFLTTDKTDRTDKSKGLELMNMDYNDIDVEQVADEVVKAEEQGKLRPAAKRESMAVRLAALSSIVREMQSIAENDRDLVKEAPRL